MLKVVSDDLPNPRRLGRKISAVVALVALALIGGVAFTINSALQPSHPVGLDVPQIDPRLYPAPLMPTIQPAPRLVPHRVTAYIESLEALRAAKVPEEDALRIAAKLTPSEFSEAIAPLVSDPQELRIGFAAFMVLLALTILFRIRRARPHIVDIAAVERIVRDAQRLEYERAVKEELS